ncbi:uncharacterized protein LOC133796080 [Humulus lupulus]|uniref:uncharacterized protein LOC133796080 n=1 Tax=Humulus lupulus TaxID=3486 RepID=UPI002B417A4A|nr:uncharacterized protein LOC133796080 [Humulus lupulus]
MVCVVLGVNPPLAVFEGFIKHIWGNLGIERIAHMNAGHTLVKFRDKATRDMVLESGVVHFDRKPILLRPWSTDLDKMRLVKSFPVWIRLLDLGLQYWGLKSLSALVSTIGKPMMMDKVTKDKSMVKFARVLVDVEISDHIPQCINFINERGQLMEQAIEFEWLPTRFSCCKSLGHTAASCKHAQEAVWRPKQKVSGSDNGELGGSTEMCEPGDEAGSKEIHQPVAGKDAQKAGKGEQMEVMGDLKARKTTQTVTIKEASSSMTGQEMKWSTPKKVGGSRQNVLTAMTLRANKYSILQENQIEVSQKCIQEVLVLKGNKVEEMMRNVFLGWNWYSCLSLEGRILLVWEEDIVSVTVTQLVVGDFNAVFEFDDPIAGRPVTEMEVEDSRLWRANAMLTLLRSSGSNFTWSNKQKEGSRVFSKLNRIFINELWIDAFPESEARINWDIISDHCYCIIKIVHLQVSGIRPFRYFNMWANHKDFWSKVLGNWSKPTGGNGLQQIIQKLRRLKSVLYQFNKMQVGDVVQQHAAAKQKYEQAQFLLQ